jgi:anti-sigma factor RsiW
MKPEKPAVTESELHAYVDGKLAENRRHEVASFLATNTPESERMNAYRVQNELLHALFDPVLAEPVPAKWLNRGRPRAYMLRQVLAASLCMVAGAALGWMLRGEYGANSASNLNFAKQAAIAHAVYTPEVRHPVEVAAEEEQHLVNWLSKRLGSPLKVPHLSTLGYELVGGRLLPSDRGPVAQFMYQDKNGQRLTLYVRTDTAADHETAFRFAQEGSVGVFYWIDRRLSYALSGEVGKEELLRVANAVYQKLNP